MRLEILAKQRRLLAAIVLSALISGFLVYLATAPAPSAQQVKSQSTDNKIQTPGTTVQSNELWMQQMRQESTLQSKKIEVLEKLLERQLVGEKPENTELTQIKQELEELKQKLNQKESSPEILADETSLQHQRLHTPLVKHTLLLRNARYALGQYIPTGAHVKAILLSAVDASVGVNVSGDPQPILLRLLGDGRLPNNTKTRMKRCHVLGAARGDLSSERVFIRLERMSCVDIDTNSIVETDVSGYVTGEDGRNGLQGLVVDRSGRMVSSAVLAGLFGVTGNFLQSWISARGNDLLAKGITDKGIQNNVVTPDVMRGNVMGVSGAFDKLAEYYIKRAEQLQPVVIVNAGRVVNIVFSKGSRYGVEHRDSTPSA